jgi:type IV secretion system protein VirB2
MNHFSKKYAVSAGVDKVNRTSLFILFFMLAIGVLMLFFPDQALASSSSSSGLPWESPLTQVKESLTGPVAYILALLAVVGGGFGLMFGGELNQFIRSLIMLVMVISLIVLAAPLLEKLFSVSGAVISRQVA